MSTRRPKHIVVGKVIARPVRGPAKANRSSWYWQARVEVDGTRTTLWSGWGTKAEVTEIVVDLLAKRPAEEPEPDVRASELEDVRDLMEVWLGAQRARLEAGDLTIYGFRNVTVPAAPPTPGSPAA